VGTTVEATDRAPRRGSPLAVRELPALFERLHGSLAARRHVIDDLNVFPVPDGDTGTNMTLTVRAGLEALQAAPTVDEDAARATIRGALRGARGNSGVILSQVVRAVVEVITSRPRMDATTYAQALSRARDLAYDAVAEPVEGTILTVIAAAAEAATVAAEDGHDLIETSRRTCVATAAAVEATTDQLDVLRHAGVVDAGGRGFEVLLAAVHGHLTGQAPPVREDQVPVRDRDATGGCAPSLHAPYEVQYLLDADDEVAGPLRRDLERLGESVVVVAAGGLLNVHIHTAEVGPAIEAALDHGRPSSIEVVHLGDQVAARRAAATPRVPLGVVAVLDGPGLQTIAREQSAVVVDGTAGRLPSVADLLDAVAAAHAIQVVLLPGHRNAVASALRVAEVMASDTEHDPDLPPVVVVDTAVSPPAVLAALAVVDPDGSPPQVVTDVRAAAAAVRAGEVVAAVRDASTPMGQVRSGQPLAVADGRVVAVEDDPIAALEAVMVALDADHAELVTLLVGAEVEDDERDEVSALVHSWGDAEVEVVEAGLRPARYWVGVE
jgi:DAK2 domain fusion protein YloV